MINIWFDFWSVKYEEKNRWKNKNSYIKLCKTKPSLSCSDCGRQGNILSCEFTLYADQSKSQGSAKCFVVL